MTHVRKPNDGKTKINEKQKESMVYMSEEKSVNFFSLLQIDGREKALSTDEGTNQEISEFMP